jgi:hypothetical protein
MMDGRLTSMMTVRDNKRTAFHPIFFAISKISLALFGRFRYIFGCQAKVPKTALTPPLFRSGIF